MKTTNTLRILAGLSFLIFFCPFFQMCSDENIPKKIIHLEPLPPENIAGDSIKIKAWKKSIEKEEQAKLEAQKEAYLEQHRKDVTQNAYEIGYIYGDIFSQGNEIDSGDLYDPFLYFVVFFIISVITALPIFILSLLKKLKTAFVLSYINMIFILLYSLFLFIPEIPIEHFYQIKYGYYLFVINSIALIFVSYKAKNQPKHAV